MCIQLDSSLPPQLVFFLFLTIQYLSDTSRDRVSKPNTTDRPSSVHVAHPTTHTLSLCFKVHLSGSTFSHPAAHSVQSVACKATKTCGASFFYTPSFTPSVMLLRTARYFLIDCCTSGKHIIGNSLTGLSSLP